jgi:hypothetical protein
MVLSLRSLAIRYSPMVIDLVSKVSCPRVKATDLMSNVTSLGPIIYNRANTKELLNYADIS